MSKPHAQRIAVVVGWTASEVTEFIEFNNEFTDTPYQDDEEVIADIEWDRTLSSAAAYADETGMSFDAAMGYYL